MQKLIEKLYYLNRSIISDDFEKSLSYIGTRIPLKIHKVPTGSKCFNWTVPKKWIIKGGFIEDGAGNRLVDYHDHILHVVVGSLPVDKFVDRQELFGHLYWLDNAPENIPYIFKYYELDWGFCIAKNDLSKFVSKQYRVKIDAEYVDDYLSIGECIIEGEINDSIAFMSHLDHPAQVQDGLSGCAVLVKLAEDMLNSTVRPYYTYRFLFFSETIGSIAYLATNDDTRRSIKYAAFLEMLGVKKQPLALQFSKFENTLIDRVFQYALRRKISNFKTGEFLTIVVNDDGVFNSPGIDIPAVSMSRSQGKDIFEYFPEYHTDKDDLEHIDYKQMGEALDILKYTISIFENDMIPVRNYDGIPHLSSAGLWIDRRVNPELNKNIRHIIYSLDNKTSIFDICYSLNLDFDEVRKFILLMEKKSLISLKRKD